MRKRPSSILVLGLVMALACAGMASAFKTSIPLPRGPEVAVNGGFKPTKLPKGKLAPAHFDLSGTIGMPDGSRPPAMEQLIVEADKDVTIDAKGLATCNPLRIEATNASAVPGGCKTARVGRGTLEFEVAPPEVTPFAVKGRVAAFNRGVRGGVTTILVHGYLSSPVSTGVAIWVKASKRRRGPFGTRWVATIPSIAGGTASLTKFELELFRLFTYKGRRRSYLLAKCPDGELLTHTEWTFDESTKLAASILQPCTPRA